MSLLLGASNPTTTFNKHGLHLRWPRIWIIILGAILIFLALCIAGMEVGHVVYDFRRSTAFGGFILFLPLLSCGIFIIITAFKPRFIFLRIATILCYIMIVLCLLLIAYDILVLIDPTRCFFLDCNGAQVTYQVNSTYNATVSGWPLNITWPTYFTTNMTAKRAFQGVQLFLACLFILCCSLYILTYIIYRRINLHQNTIYNADHHTSVVHEKVVSPIKHTNHIVHSNPPHPLNRSITVYKIDGHSFSSTKHNNQHSAVPAAINAIVPQNTNKIKSARPRTSSVNQDRICTRCMQEPRMTLTTNYERQNFFSHLCASCNNDILHDRRKTPLVTSAANQSRKPY